MKKIVLIMMLLVGSLSFGKYEDLYNIKVMEKGSTTLYSNGSEGMVMVIKANSKKEAEDGFEAFVGEQVSKGLKIKSHDVSMGIETVGGVIDYADKRGVAMFVRSGKRIELYMLTDGSVEGISNYIGANSDKGFYYGPAMLPLNYHLISSM